MDIIVAAVGTVLVVGVLGYVVGRKRGTAASASTDDDSATKSRASPRSFLTNPLYNGVTHAVDRRHSAVLGYMDVVGSNEVYEAPIRQHVPAQGSRIAEGTYAPASVDPLDDNTEALYSVAGAASDTTYSEIEPELDEAPLQKATTSKPEFSTINSVSSAAKNANAGHNIYNVTDDIEAYEFGFEV